MKISRAKILSVANAIYQICAAEADDGEHPIPNFSRLAPTAKQFYERMAEAAIAAERRCKS